MKLVEATNYVNALEKEHNLICVKYQNVSIWPFIRTYYIDSLSKKTEVKSSPSSIICILKSLFFYNPLSVFKKYDAWLFCSSSNRKKVGTEYIQPAFGVFSKLLSSSLMFEHPDVHGINYSKSVIPEKGIVSNAWNLMFVHVIMILLKLKKIHINNQDALDEVIINGPIKFEYSHYARLLLAQKITTDILLYFTRRPKVVFMECPYTQMGYVWAFHNHHIPVVELQHGVLNANHYAYNSNYYGEILAPDEICVYGEKEYYYLTKIQTNYSKVVSMTGLYMLECAEKSFNKDIFEEYRNRYESVIVVAGQPSIEKMLSSFIDSVASLLKDVLFVYIPRRFEKDIIFKSTNVVYKYGVNIYEYLKWCDIHSTVTSTTCLEAHFFYKPTIFYSNGTPAKEYYSNIIKEVNGGFYIYNEKEFVEAYEKIKGKKFTFKELFAHGVEENYRRVIEKYIK